MISVIIPSYGRADRIRERVENCFRNSVMIAEIAVVVEEEDADAYYDALIGHANVRLLLNQRTRNYAGAVNTAATNSRVTGDYLFLGADDLNFHPRWDIEAVNTMDTFDHIKVVGTNDLLNSYVLKGWHATHYLIDRGYLDEPGGVIDGDRGHVLFEGYDHNYTDTEFIGTAKARAVFTPCLSSVVEHMHPTVGKGVADETFAKTQLNIDSDSVLYDSRKHLWWDLSR